VTFFSAPARCTTNNQYRVRCRSCLSARTSPTACWQGTGTGASVHIVQRGAAPDQSSLGATQIVVGSSAPERALRNLNHTADRRPGPHWPLGRRLLHLQQCVMETQLLRWRGGDSHVPPGSPNVPPRLHRPPAARLPHRQAVRRCELHAAAEPRRVQDTRYARRDGWSIWHARPDPRGAA
jgi:hypothetical protein